MEDLKKAKYKLLEEHSFSNDKIIKHEKEPNIGKSDSIQCFREIATLKQELNEFKSQNACIG